MDIGSLTGSIVIEDKLSGALSTIAKNVQGYAKNWSSALDNVSKDLISLSQGAGGATEALGVGLAGAAGVAAIAVTGVAIAAAAAAAAVVGLTKVTIELGNRGSDVNDVAATFQNFSGSVDKANANLAALRKGTLDTVSDFDLMKAGSKLLAAGVKLTSDQFGTLSSAAFVLQNQGLGPTKDMLDLVSQALLTGRTRTLEMKIGKIDLAKAERDYAASLGVEKLSRMQKVEADRIGILDAMNRKVKEAGEQQRDFGENMEAAIVAIKNWGDKLASAVAASPHVMAAVDSIGAALKRAFGTTSSNALDASLEVINRFADGVAKYGPSIISGIGSMVDGLISTWKTLSHGYDTYIRPLFESNEQFAARMKANVPQTNLKVGNLPLGGLNLPSSPGWQVKGFGSELNKPSFIGPGVTMAGKGTGVLGGAASEVDTAKVDAAADALEKYRQKIKALADELSGKVIVTEAKDMLKALQQSGPIADMTAGHVKQINETMGKARDVFHAWGQDVPDDIRAVYEATFRLTDQIPLINKWQDSLAHSADGIVQFVPIAEKLAHETWPTTIDGIDNYVNAVENAQQKTQSFGEKIQSGLIDTLQQIPQLVVNAFTGGGGLMGALQGVGSMLGASLGSIVGKSFESLGSLGGPIGAALGSLVGPAIQGISKLFTDEGRNAAKGFAASFGGFNDLHAQLLKVPEGLGEALWVELTQHAGSEANVAKIVDKIKNALANTPEALASAAGYQTRDELQAVADKAKEVYDYMVSSGKYTASALADAFQKSKDAQIAAMSDEAKAHQDSLDEITARYKGMFEKLDTEYKSLSDSVAGEAEEEFMGVVETQQRARMKQIEEEKAHLQEKQAAEESAADKTYQAWLEAGATTDAALRELFQKPYEIPIHWKADEANYMAGGGTVPGGPRGSDTVPTWLTPGETVVPAGRNEQPITINNTIKMPNNEVLAKQIVKTFVRSGL